jgi:hypothetical protein
MKLPCLLAMYVGIQSAHLYGALPPLKNLATYHKINLQKILLAELQPEVAPGNYDENIVLKNYPRVEKILLDQLIPQYIEEFIGHQNTYGRKSFTQHKIATFITLYANGNWIPIWKEANRTASSVLAGYAFMMAYRTEIEGSIEGTENLPEEIYPLQALTSLCWRAGAVMKEGREKAYRLTMEILQNEQIEDITPWEDFLRQTEKEIPSNMDPSSVHLVKTVMAAQIENE